MAKASSKLPFQNRVPTTTSLQLPRISSTSKTSDPRTSTTSTNYTPTGGQQLAAPMKTQPAQIDQDRLQNNMNLSVPTAEDPKNPDPRMETRANTPPPPNVRDAAVKPPPTLPANAMNSGGWRTAGTANTRQANLDAQERGMRFNAGSLWHDYTLGDPTRFEDGTPIPTMDSGYERPEVIEATRRFKELAEAGAGAREADRPTSLAYAGDTPTLNLSGLTDDQIAAARAIGADPTVYGPDANMDSAYAAGSGEQLASGDTFGGYRDTMTESGYSRDAEGNVSDGYLYGLGSGESGYRQTYSDIPGGQFGTTQLAMEGDEESSGDYGYGDWGQDINEGTEGNRTHYGESDGINPNALAANLRNAFSGAQDAKDKVDSYSDEEREMRAALQRGGHEITDDGDIYLDGEYRGNLHDPESWHQGVKNTFEYYGSRDADQDTPLAGRGDVATAEQIDNSLGGTLSDQEKEYVGIINGTGGYHVDVRGNIIDEKSGAKVGSILEDPSTWPPNLARSVSKVEGDKGTGGADILAQMKELLENERPEGVDVEELVQAQRDRRAIEESRNLQTLASGAARAGLTPGASLGAQAGFSQTAAAEGQQQDAALKLQGEIQNMQQQMDFFNKKAQALFAQAQFEQDAQARKDMFAQALALQRQGEMFQREMYELQNQVSASDIFGGILGGIVSPIFGGLGAGIGGAIGGLFNSGKKGS